MRLNVLKIRQNNLKDLQNVLNTKQGVYGSSKAI